jgi:hypothetical protein
LSSQTHHLHRTDYFSIFYFLHHQCHWGAYNLACSLLLSVHRPHTSHDQRVQPDNDIPSSLCKIHSPEPLVLLAFLSVSYKSRLKMVLPTRDVARKTMAASVVLESTYPQTRHCSPKSSLASQSSRAPRTLGYRIDYHRMNKRPSCRNRQ